MTKSIKVLKKPLSIPMANRPKAFPPMPILYLELLENKKKIKPNLIGTEFVINKSAEPISTTNPIEKPKTLRKSENRPKKPFIEIIDDNDPIMTIKEDEPRVSNNREPKSSSIKVHSRDDQMSRPKDDQRPHLEERQRIHSVKPRSTRPASYKSKSIAIDPIESKLKKLLNDSEHEGDFIKKTRSSLLNKPTHMEDEGPQHDQQAHSRQDDRRDDGPVQEPLPPRLSELPKSEAASQFTDSNLKNINLKDVTDSKEQDALKSDLLFKFDILKKKYKDAPIPEFNQFSDYDTMKRTYESSIKRLALDGAVDNYKKYLIAGFVLLEFVTGKFLSDASGFAQQQIVSISSYDRLLIELGEKSHVHQPSKIPVELRLLGLIVFNMFLFIIMKLIFKKTGLTNIMPGANNTSNTNNTKKRKMKGPSVNLD